MLNKSLKRRVCILFLLGALLGGGAGWGLYHFVISPKYHSVDNATRL